jgi:hypothetical protein
MMEKQKYDDSVFTRRWCVFGLTMSWLVGIGALIAGAICMYMEIHNGEPAKIVMSNTNREILPLVLNIFGKCI